MPSATTNGAAPVTEARAAVPRSEPRLVKPVPITLDKDRTLVMDFTAMDAFEEATGLSAWGREAWLNPSPRILSALIWAGLLHEDPELTLEAVRAMPGMHLANLAYLSERVGELWGEIMPEADPADEAAAPEASDDPNPRRRPG